jgi:hypothetical protein
MFDTALLPIGTVGTGRQSWNLPGGYQIAGITIDNPSGSWLYIPQDHTFIAPYTLGFAHSFAPTLSRIDIRFANGPAGQVSTQQGDPPTAYIYDTPVGESAGQVSTAGAAFITQFTPVLTVNNPLVLATFTGTTGTLLVAIANQRYRVLTIDVSRAPGNPAGDSGAGYTIRDGIAPGTFDDKVNGQISKESPTSHHLYPAGMDMTVGRGVSYTANGDFSDTTLAVSMTYQVI